MVTLREYQAKAVADIRDAYVRKFRAPLFVLPTGGGKTVLFTYIAQNASSRGNKVLILVHRVELLRQTSKTLRGFGVRHGLINPNYTPDYGASVQVASVQTMVNRMDRLPFSPDIIIIDEAHHATASTWRKVVEKYPKARLLGVTATPVRGDGEGLGVEAGGLFDILIEGPTTRQLMDMGFLVDPIIYAPKDRLDLSGIRTKMGDYDKRQLSEVMDKPMITGDAVAHYKRLCDRVPAVAFCVSVAHAEHVASEFRTAGYRAYAVDGAMEDDARTRILSGLGKGTVDVVCSCDLISEGTDIPAIGCAILLRPTQSTGLYLQQIGRALRPCEGKDRAVILDHVGNVLYHGLPDAPRQWNLEGESKKRKGKKEKSAPNAVQCNSCFAIHEPAPKCPVCGHVELKAAGGRKLDTQEGELTQITEQQVIKMEARKRQGKAQTLEELRRIGMERGYKPSWAEHVFKARKQK